MFDELWAFFFGGEAEQQVVIVNTATLSDAYEFRRRLYAETGGEVPTRIQVEDELENGEARICLFVSGGLFKDPLVKVFSARLPHSGSPRREIGHLETT